MIDLPKTYMVRKKFLKIFGAKIFIETTGQPVQLLGNAKLKALKLKEDVRIYADEAQTEELIRIHARSILDFGAVYDVFESGSEQKLGSVKRNFGKSLFRDSWEIWDKNETVVGKIDEDSMALALVRRFLSNLVPQRFGITDANDTEIGRIVQNFNPFTVKLQVELNEGTAIDEQLVMVATIMLAAIEGRQN